MKLAAAILRYSTSKRSGGTIGSTQNPMAKRSCFHGGRLVEELATPATTTSPTSIFFITTAVKTVGDGAFLRTSTSQYVGVAHQLHQHRADPL